MTSVFFCAQNQEVKDFLDLLLRSVWYIDSCIISPWVSVVFFVVEVCDFGVSLPVCLSVDSAVRDLMAQRREDTYFIAIPIVSHVFLKLK